MGYKWNGNFVLAYKVDCTIYIYYRYFIYCLLNIFLNIFLKLSNIAIKCNL